MERKRLACAFTAGLGHFARRVAGWGVRLVSETESERTLIAADIMVLRQVGRTQRSYAEYITKRPAVLQCANSYSGIALMAGRPFGDATQTRS
jgi:hypothetical protein